MNFAAVQKVPLVVVGENNHWAYSTPISQQMACSSLAERAKAYGVPAATVDGNDVEAVHAAAREAVERAREGGGPFFLEAVTYRMKGHAEHDAQDYVDKSELAAWSERDPLERYARRLREDRVATEAMLSGIDAAVQKDVDAELAVAESAPPPAPEDRPAQRLRAAPERDSPPSCACRRTHAMTDGVSASRRDPVLRWNDVRRRHPRRDLGGDGIRRAGS